MKKEKPNPVTTASQRRRDKEIIRRTETYDVFQRLEAGVSHVGATQTDLNQFLQEAFGQGNTVQLNMRIPSAKKAFRSRLACQRIDATTLPRIWLAERKQPEVTTGV